jgi:hypothetical protein
MRDSFRGGNETLRKNAPIAEVFPRNVRERKETEKSLKSHVKGSLNLNAIDHWNFAQQRCVTTTADQPDNQAVE